MQISTYGYNCLLDAGFDSPGYFFLWEDTAFPKYAYRIFTDTSARQGPSATPNGEVYPVNEGISIKPFPLPYTEVRYESRWILLPKEWEYSFYQIDPEILCYPRTANSGSVGTGGDFTNHPHYSLANPEYEVTFSMNLDSNGRRYIKFFVQNSLPRIIVFKFRLDNWQGISTPPAPLLPPENGRDVLYTECVANRTTHRSLIPNNLMFLFTELNIPLFLGYLTPSGAVTPGTVSYLSLKPYETPFENTYVSQILKLNPDNQGLGTYFRTYPHDRNNLSNTFDEDTAFKPSLFIYRGGNTKQWEHIATEQVYDLIPTTPDPVEAIIVLIEKRKFFPMYYYIERVTESEALMWFHEVPIGTVDGVNITFHTTYNYVAGSTMLFINGQRLVPGVSYIEYGEGVIHMLIAVSPGDTFYIDYIKTG